MNKSNNVKIRVPATTANMGAGFDCIGAALSLYNHFEFTLAEKTSFIISGKEGENIELGEDNLLYQSFLKFYAEMGQPAPSVEVKIEVGVPLARGLGSSATAIVGGLLGANYFSAHPLTSEELMELAIAIEGHPDNVIPAFLGNCILSVQGKQGWQFVPITCHPDISFVLAIPDFELATEKARAVLPSSLTYSQAVYNIAHMGLLIKALETGNETWLREALGDEIHQPFRRSLIKGYDDIEKAVLAEGAYGMVISGAGPTLLTLCHHSLTSQVSQVIEATWTQLGVKPQVKPLSIEVEGAVILD
ncbi:MAG: homoserine kinase [Cyanobacterium sp. T60_A2020_053]|nr:homoserine kinase [Cyanobacterium sp. T60_A2020_053]